MKRSQRLKAWAVLMLLVGILIAVLWLVVTISRGEDLAMNGPWLLAVLACVVAANLAFWSMVAEAREREESRQTYLAVERAKERRDARR